MSTIPIEFEGWEVEDIIKEAKQNDNEFAQDFLIMKYKGMVYGVIKKGYYLPNGEQEDLVQEGLMGIHKAINDFDSDNNTSFESFCQLVIQRRIITAVKKATRKKNEPLNKMHSYDKPLPDNENLTMLDRISARPEVLNDEANNNKSNEEILILQEVHDSQKSALIEILSDYERNVLSLFIEGWSYDEMREKLEAVNNKKIDNTIQRIKRKMSNIKLFDEDYQDKLL